MNMIHFKCSGPFKAKPKIQNHYMFSCKMISFLLPAVLSCPHSDGNGSLSMQWHGEGEAHARFKDCIGTNTKVEGGICQ